MTILRLIVNDLSPRRKIFSLVSTALLVVGIVGLVVSGLISTPQPKIFTDTSALASPAPNSYNNAPVAPAHHSATPTAVSVTLSFHVMRLFSNETLLALSPVTGGITVSVSDPLNGTRDLVLSEGLGPGRVTTVLIPHMRSGSNHALTLIVNRSGVLKASVDHKQVFFYTFAKKRIFLQPTKIALGANLGGTQHFYGSISNVTTTTFSAVSNGGTTTRTILRIIAISSLAIALLILALLLYFERQFLQRSTADNDTEESSESGPAGRKWQPVALGIVFIIGGALLLQYITPADNVIATRIGQQTLNTWIVPDGGQSLYSLEDQPTLLNRASSTDVRITFEIKVFSYPALPTEVIGTGDTPSDFGLILHDNGFFVANAPLGVIHVVWPIAVGVIPGSTWIPVEFDQEQNRTFDIHFDHQLAYSYTFNAKEWTINPMQLSLGLDAATAKILIRHAKVVTTEYGTTNNHDGALRIRLLQLLGGLLIGLGVIVLAARFAKKLVPRAPKSSAPLVKVTFGVLATGIVANILFLLHVHQTAPYYSNSSWLFAIGARFSDYFQALELFISRDPYGMQRGAYPPFGYLLLGPFAWMERYAGLIALLSLFLGFFIWWVHRAFTRGVGRLMTIVVVLASLFSLPVTFAIDRANTDLLAVIFVILGGAALERDRKTLSSFYFGLVGAAKALPIALVFVFFRWRRLRYILIGGVIAGVVTLLSFEAFTGGSISTQISAIRSANDLASQSYLNTAISTPFNTAILGFVQAIGFAINGTPGGQLVNDFAHQYVFLEELIGGLAIAVYFFFFERTEWRLMTVATAGILLLPGVTGYYSLLYVFVPLALFIRRAPYNRRTIFIAVLFGLILMPRTYEFWGVGPFADSSLLTTAPLLLLLVGATVWDSIVERRANKQFIPDADGENPTETPELDDQTTRTANDSVSASL